MAFDLAAQTQHEPPIRIRVQIPGLARHDRRAARECHGDRRRQLDPLGRESGKGERRKDVVAELDRHQRVEPGGLRRCAKWPRFAPVPHRQHRKDTHPITPQAIDPTMPRYFPARQAISWPVHIPMRSQEPTG